MTYRGREVDQRDADRYDAPRRRIPTALDPYAYPDDRDELKRNIAMVKARNAKYHSDERGDYDPPLRRDVSRDDISTKSVRGTTRPDTTKTTYSVTSAGLEKESETISRPTAPVDTSAVLTRYDRQERGDYEPARSSIRGPTRPYDDREFARTERIYETERPRREAGGYVVDMRDADVIDVYSGSGARGGDPGFVGYRGDPYDDALRDPYSRGPPPRDYGYRRSEAVIVDRDDGRTSASSLKSGGPYMSGARTERAPTAIAARSQTSFREAPPRSSPRVYAEDLTTKKPAYGPSRTLTRGDEEDWGFIERTTQDARAPSVRESLRDPNYDDAYADTPRGRGRSSTFNKPPSEAEYVMVSPPREGAPSGTNARSGATAQTLRSAIFNESSYTPEERLRRRRSRSISFRDEEAQGHHVGEGKYHERPGAEAVMMGRYLNSYDANDDRMDYAYSSRSRRDPQERDYDYDTRERNSAKYAPQRVRSRSRRRKENEDDDYTSIYREKTTKTTYH